MHFTREPIIETVITAKEGCKLCLRSSKGAGHEEYQVDAVEVISFGNNCFYRSLERPKSFILPLSDYEIIEVRETKMVLKTPSLERGIKIGGGKEAVRPVIKEEEKTEEQQPAAREKGGEKKRERKRFRRRREKDETETPIDDADLPMQDDEEQVEKIALIPPPSTLISETISRYKDLPVYAGAFFEREKVEMIEEEAEEPKEEIQSVDINQQI